MFVLERLYEKYFRRVGTAPHWCAEIYPESDFDTAVISPSERFPFLEFFLEEAELFWAQGQDGVLRSDNWIETGPDGKERYLDSMALNVGTNHLLIINLLGMGTTERQTLLQESRENQVSLERQLAEALRRVKELESGGKSTGA